MQSWARFPFVRFTAALCLGIIGFLLSEQTTPLLWALLLASGLVAAFFAFVQARKLNHRQNLFIGLPGLVFLVVAGWLLAQTRSEQYSKTHFQRLPAFSAYEAVLISHPESRANSFRAIAQVQRIQTQEGWVAATGRVLLSITKNLDSPPRYGDQVLIAAPPQAVESPRNPEEFNYQRFLSHQNIFHRQFLNENTFQKIGQQPPWRLMQVAYNLNRQADSILTSRLGDRREFGVAKAMLLGVRDDLDPEIMRAYSASGAVHILSVSGLHVAVLFWVLGWCLGWLKRDVRFGRWLYLGLMLGMLWFYALLTGLSPAVLRSAAMITLFLLRETLQKQASPYNTLFASAFILLLFDPYLLTSAGFQLSYLAVLGIIYLQPRIQTWWSIDNKVGRWFWKITATALAAQLATFPLSIYYFHQFPVYFLLVNPAVMFISFFALPFGMALLFFHWVPFLNVALTFLTRISFWLLNEAAIQTERLPHAVWESLYLSDWETVGFYALLISLLALFYTRRMAYLQAAVVLTFVLSSGAILQKLAQRNQRVLVIHQVSRYTAISLIEGNRLTVLTDSALVNRPLQLAYPCAGLWAKRGIRNKHFISLQNPQPAPDVRIHQLPTGWIIAWKNKTLVSQTTSAYGPAIELSGPADYWLMKGDESHFSNRSTLDSDAKIIIDGSCKPWHAASWRLADRNTHSTATQGAFVAEY
ncbi:MAG: competence protein ComEC family protein [Cytophagaceae bacterium]|nr:competence protein ComEC family protein [Cytophagaceae bacterium]